MFAMRPRPMVWYYALPTGHHCIYLLACAVNLIDTTECLKRSARMVSPSVSGSFRISMECSGFALANPGQIMICICRPVTFSDKSDFHRLWALRFTIALHLIVIIRLSERYQYQPRTRTLPLPRPRPLPCLTMSPRATAPSQSSP